MDFTRFIIEDFDHWTLFLHKRQYYLGRTYLWAKREDDVSLAHASVEEWNELRDLSQKVILALHELFQPSFCELHQLGNVAHHLHVHIVPRYDSRRVFEGISFVDAQWGKEYAPYNRDFRVPEDVLFGIRDVIKEKLL